MDNQEREDLSRIRHYKGTVKDFKNYWDEMAGVETNAFGTPEYQGFNDVHPTRGDNQSPHWKTSNLSEGEVNEKVKIFMRNVLSKMIPAAFGPSTNAKMRDEIKDAVQKAIEPILLKYDYIVESDEEIKKEP